MMYSIVTLLLLLPILNLSAGEVTLCAGGTGYQTRDGYAVEKNDYTRYGVRFEGKNRVPVTLSPKQADALYEKLEREFNDQEQKRKRTRPIVKQRHLEDDIDLGPIIGFSLGAIGVFVMLAVYARTYGELFIS